MTKLNNGIAVYEKKNNGMINVMAMFRGEIEIVFQSFDQKEVVKYCHENGMKAVSKEVYNNNENASFRKKNAKHQFNENEWKFGTVC